MKISKNSIEDLLNPLFCGIDDAIAYAESVNSEEVWCIVLRREDLPIERVIELTYGLDFDSVWQMLVADTRLLLSIAVDISGNRESAGCWPIVLSRADVGFDYALEIAKGEFSTTQIWKVALLYKGASPSNVVKHAIEANNQQVWNFLLKEACIIQYFAKMQIEEILEIAEKADCPALWIFAMENKEAEPIQILHCAKKSQSLRSRSSWAWALEQEKVIIYLEGLPVHELIALAKEINSPRLWEKILLIRPDMWGSIAFLHLKEAQDNDVWDDVLSRWKVRLYITRLKPTTAISLAKRINNWRIWKIVAGKANLKKYLLKLNWDEALDVALNTDSPEIKSIVLARLDIAIADIVEFAAPLLSNKEWNTILHRSDFIGYLQSLNDVEAISFAAISGNTDIWIEVLSRPSIKPADAIACAKQSEIENVWEVVKHRKDVAEYLKGELS